MYFLCVLGVFFYLFYHVFDDAFHEYFFYLGIHQCFSPCFMSIFFCVSIYQCIFYVFQPDVESGDVYVVLQEQEHETFVRKGNDLICTYNIGLTEALCGFHKTIKHLDGRTLLMKCAPGNVIGPGTIYWLDQVYWTRYFL